MNVCITKMPQGARIFINSLGMSPRTNTHSLAIGRCLALMKHNQRDALEQLSRHIDLDADVCNRCYVMWDTYINKKNVSVKVNEGGYNPLLCALGINVFSPADIADMSCDEFPSIVNGYVEVCNAFELFN